MYKTYRYLEKFKLSSLALACGIGVFAHSSTADILFSDDFELGLGNWKNVTSGDNKNWTRDSGGTPSSGTGPSIGAGGSAYYAYLETSSGSAYTAGDTAILEGPAISGSGVSLKFDYHMYGSNMGTLAIDVLTNGVWTNDVWSISGQQHTSNSAQYTSADVDLSGYSVEQIRFRATAAGNYRGDMAIDNVVIESLPTGPVAPEFLEDPVIKSEARQDVTYMDSIADSARDRNGDAITFMKVSGPAWLNVAADGSLSGTPLAEDVGVNSFIVEVSDGSLTDSATLEVTVNDDSTPIVLFNDNFESNFGNWINTSSGDTRNWTRLAGSTPSSSTGPSGGSPSGGYYVYLETSSGQAYNHGDSAILLGPQLSDSSIHLNFDYHMYGSEIGTLAVDGYSNGSWTNSVWEIAGQQQTSSAAAYTRVNLDLSQYDFSQVRFRAVAAGGYMGDIALDNIEVLAINPAKLDSDNDGVVNLSDLCPETPLGEPVNDEGCSLSQIDSDGDGVVDSLDAFPNDASETVDTDGDGIGNNADTDDDNDNVEDVNDAFPFDANESVDTDGDGIGNNADTDDDNDGVSDSDDAFPLDASETIDTDGDGIGNNADNDDDNDNVEDANDAFPLDSSESVDTDGDGVGNNADTDDDNDQLSDADEINVYQTNPLSTDTDLDGMPDGWEVQYELFPTMNDADGDLDNDGYSNLIEFQALTNPNDADSFPVVAIESMSLNSRSSCALVDDEIVCWGSIGPHYTPPANITAPEQVAHTVNADICARQGNDVTCWDEGGTHTASIITDLQTNPVDDAVSLHAALNTGTACVINLAEEVSCWGSSYNSVDAPPADLANVQQMDMFGSHACAHDGSTVSCWGLNSSFQLDVPVDLGTPEKVVVGGSHTCVLQTDQQVQCWGNDTDGQASVPTGIGNIVALDAGNAHTCAVNDQGQLFCWGAMDQSDIPAGLNYVTEIYSGLYNNCAMTATEAVCWGRNEHGQSSIWYNVKDYGVGDNHVCAINDEQVMCFGQTNNQPNVLDIPGDIQGPQKIGVGRYHSCVWADSGMHCWGKSGEQLNFPADLTDVTEIDARVSHTCAIDNGVVRCWGNNFNGVLNVPTNIVQPRELSVGDDHNCVIDGNSTVRCWGANYRGQSSDRFNLTNATAVATGGIGAYPHDVDDGHSCVASDSGVQCWGSNTYNVLNVPPGLTNVIDLHAGWGTSCALDTSGVVSCWGDFISPLELSYLNVGNVTKIKGYNSEVCAQGDSKLGCSGGHGSALLINH